MMIKVSTKAEILLNADLKGLIRERDEYFQAKNTMHNKSLRREGPKMNPTSLFIGIMRITCLRNRMATVIRSNSSRKLLSSLNPYKAVGPDGLHPRVPKELSSAIAPANCSASSEPHCSLLQCHGIWKQAYVTPIITRRNLSSCL